MKKLTLIMSMLIMCALLSCNNNRRTDLPNDNRALDHSTDMNTTDANRTMTNSDQTQMEPTGTQTNSGMDWTNQDRDDMYQHLNMTQDQRNRFEQAMNTNSNTNTDAAQMQRDRDSKLRAILNDDQYRKYEQWHDDRMNKNRNNNSGM